MSKVLITNGGLRDGDTLTIRNVDVQEVGNFTDLGDTPNSYDDGKFLQSTASGIIYASLASYATDEELLAVSGTLQSSIENIVAGAVSWEVILNKPATFPPAEHFHSGVYQPVGDYTTNTQLITTSGVIVAQIPTNYYTQEQVNTISGALNTAKANAVHTHIESDITDLGDYATVLELTTTSGVITTASDNTYVKKNGSTNITGQQTFEDNVVVRGNLVVSGTEFFAEVEQVLIEDHLLTINHGETASGISFPYAGIEVDRGTATNFLFVFDEESGYFEVGKEGSLQAVATREDVPIDGNVPFWSSAAKQFLTTGSVSLSDIATEEYVNTVSGSIQDKLDSFNPLPTQSGHSGKYLSTDGTDASWSTLTTDLVGDTSPQLGGDLDLNEYSIDYTASLSEDWSYVGDYEVATVDGNAFGVGCPLYLKANGNYDSADASSVDTVPCVALALEEEAGSNKKVLLRGSIRNDTWDWNVGKPIYLSEMTGRLTQTTPTTSEAQVQVLGYAKSADTMFFNPNYGIAEVM